ncbi:putative meiosis arrest female protein 1-like [Apostichopus japonicus]|uniref:Putative meiosis arrest female protein 1-like n=1 Tax=Stichopus japonicus TaxID=307972 RepID=A0A2G8KBM9_STIJA|nr:putative meiosis arrest female protein 1-like [Apostichopus japonicus]
MLVSPPMVPNMGTAPMFSMLPGYQPPAACASCHLGSVDMMRQLTLGTSFSPSTPSIPSISQATYPASGQDSQDILAMLRQSGDNSLLQCQECEKTSCSSTVDEPISLLPQMEVEGGMSKPVVNSLPDLTSSPKRLFHSPIRAVPSPIRRNLVPVQSPLTSFLAQLNESRQFQSPDRSSSRDDKSDNLPPIGVFWDIENCCVPSGKSAFEVVRRIRDRFFEGHREAEFMCVCDIKKENSTVIEELNNAQVTVAHINAVAKNAADDKLKQSLRRFADTHSRPATVVLISGDINFAHDLSDLRHRHGLNVILVHKSDSSEALKSCANSLIKYSDLITDLPYRSPSKHQTVSESNLLAIHNLPIKRAVSSVRVRLEQLSENCGGKVVHLSNGTAVIKFPNQESAFRAKKRLEGENVFGNLISVAFQRYNGGYNNSPKSYKDNRKRGSNLDDSQRSSPCHDVDAQQHEGEDTASIPSPARVIPKEQREDGAANQKKETNRNVSPMPSVTPFQKKIPNWTSLPSTQFRPLQERSYSPYSMNNSHDIKYRRSPAGDNGVCFRSIPSVQRVTPPMNQTLFLPDGGISPLPMKGTYRAPTPIQVATNQTKSQWEPPPGVDLLVTNLDNKMTRKELKRLLSAAIGRHAKVLHMKLFAPTQGHFQATVRVPNQADAMRTLLKVNGAPIGAWKIEISLLPASDSNADKLRQMVIPLLQSNGSFSLPLTEFKKAFQQKYDQVVYTFDLYQIPETVTLRDTTSGKVISLSNQSRPETPNIPSYLSSSSRQSPMIPTRDSTPQPCARWCPLHIKDISKVVIEECVDLNISVSLRTFSAQVLTLLEMHNGAISLASFPVCYRAEYTFNKDVNGVPLEHLISCVKGVFIMVGHDTFKYICLPNKKQQGEDGNKGPPLLPHPLFNFSREVMDLLKYSSLCKVDYHKFATEYHHKFNKQCRVADYGFLKLSELFDAISQSVQVLGEEDNKIITLSHQTQMKRFAQDALKVLRSQASKQVTAREFPIAFQRMFGRMFNPAEYGLCSLLDLISELTDSQLVVEGQGLDIALSIPKRDQRRFGQEDHPVRCGTIGKPLSEDKPIPPSEQRQVDDDRIGGADIHEILRMVSQLAGVGAPELPPSSLRVPACHGGERGR